MPRLTLCSRACVTVKGLHSYRCQNLMSERGRCHSRKNTLKNSGWNTAFDLDNTDSKRSQSLPVLPYQESLDTVSRKIAVAAKTAIEESGMNMLYLVFGFLEWYESDDSTQPHLAPLVIVPVAIERNVSRGKILEPCHLCASADGRGRSRRHRCGEAHLYWHKSRRALQGNDQL